MNTKPFSTFVFREDDFPIIAEIAQAHDGSLGAAHAYIDAVADQGAHAIKFQTHIAAEESTLDEPWRVKFSQQDALRYDYWKRMEFTPEQWSGLADHTRERGLEFLSSPFSVAAVELLDRLDVPCWKVASGEIYNPEILAAIFATRKPVMFSSGMSSIQDLTTVTDRAMALGTPFLLFQCTTSYPCPPETWGLKLIPELRQQFDCPVGFSDHSGGIHAGLAAATIGADLLELHVTFSKAAFGPDTPASITLEELGQLVRWSREIKQSMATSYDKNAIATQSDGLRSIFGRSWTLKRPLSAGSIIAEGDLTLKKPAGGFAYEERGAIVGRTLARDKTPDRLLRLEDFEERE